MYVFSAEITRQYNKICDQKISNITNTGTRFPWVEEQQSSAVHTDKFYKDRKIISNLSSLFH